MIARRDLLIGAACGASVIVGNGLRPHRSVTLLQSGKKLADLVPATFGGWLSQETGDPLAINGPGTLSSQIYNEIVGRTYTNQKAQTQVAILLAYGARQSDDLQLHRPEICYPAFGFALNSNEPAQIPLGANVEIPSRRLVAVSSDHAENVVYWTRFGENLPQDGGQQRAARFEAAARGIIPDGVLCRFSTQGDYPALRWPILYGFIAELLNAISPANRRILIGTARGNTLASAPQGRQTIGT